MSLTINTNIEALNASRNLNSTETKISMAMQHLSSGLKINSAADDVAGYAISQSLTAQTNGLNQATENAQDAVALAQTAQGALNDVEQMLQRIRELSVQSENGTTSEAGKTSIKEEQEQLTKEITRVAETTEFNGTKLLTGGAAIKFQIGANEGKTEQIEVKAAEVKAPTEFKIGKIEEAIAEIAKAAGSFGAAQDRVQYALSNTEIYSQNLASANSAISDVNMASEMTNFTKLNVLQSAGVAILAQANAQPQSVLKLLE